MATWMPPIRVNVQEMLVNEIDSDHLLLKKLVVLQNLQWCWEKVQERPT